MSILKAFESMDYGTAPESASEARAWIAAHAAGFGHYINGAFTAPHDLFVTRNPATDNDLAQVSGGSAEDVEAAVAAARAAQGPWEAMGGAKRARHLYALARLIQKNARVIAVLETLDNGKPIRESRDIDVPLAARHFYHHAGWAQLLEAEFPHSRAHGVAGQIIPWNFPFLMLAWKLAPALAAGNTVVLKPAEYTPLSALFFAELCTSTGLPPGVVNIVTGDGETGAALVRHPGIDKLAFTGSTEVGRLIRRETAGRNLPLTLELGGKSPFIVLEEADLDAAVEGVVDAIWFNQGQVCCAGSRLLVQESVAPRFIALLKRRMQGLRIGDPLDKTIDMGAIVDPVQLEHIRKLVASGIAEGAEITQSPCPLPEHGCFYPPTLLTGVEASMRVAQEEIFGPVLVAMTFRTPDEAVQLANNTRYGLAASIWSENINVALDLAPRIKAGVVWINATNLLDAAAGFGGYRESGYGREGGREGMHAWLRPRAEPRPLPARIALEANGATARPDSVDRTRKLYVGGKQARPDGGHDRAVLDPSGAVIGQVGEGNRKDIRNAVEAAVKAQGWASSSGHARAQILYYIAENLSQRTQEFARTIDRSVGGKGGAAEVEAAVDQLFTWAAWADKYDGQAHDVPIRGMALAMNEAIGTIAVLCPEQPSLLGLIASVAPAIAMGNTVVAVPSQGHPLAGMDLMQVFETSDLPAGVVNLVSGDHAILGKTLAEHLAVDAIWAFGDADQARMIETASTGNLKQCWCASGLARDWGAPGEQHEFLRRATQVKNIWIPWGA